MLAIGSADQYADLEYLNPFLLSGSSSKEKLLLIPTVPKIAKAKDRCIDFIC